MRNEPLVFFGIAIALLLIVVLVKRLFYLRDKRGNYAVTLDRPLDDVMNIYKIEGFGFDLLGHFRDYQGTYATYRFFTILWLPIMPLSCVRVGENKKTSFISNIVHASAIAGGGFSYSEPAEGYDIYSMEKWNILEVLSIYLERYGITTTIICLVWGVFLLFN